MPPVLQLTSEFSLQGDGHLWEAAGELKHYAARKFRTSVPCLCSGGMRLDLAVLGAAGRAACPGVCAHPAHPLRAAGTAGAWARRDRQARQKTCTAGGANAATLHSDPEPAKPGGFGERVSAGVGSRRGGCEVPHRQGQKGGGGNPKWRELAAEPLCASQAACEGKCKFSNRFFQF